MNCSYNTAVQTSSNDWLYYKKKDIKYGAINKRNVYIVELQRTIEDHPLSTIDTPRQFQRLYSKSVLLYNKADRPISATNNVVPFDESLIKTIDISRR